MIGNRPDYDAQLSIEWMERYRHLFMFLITAYALFVISVPRIWKRRSRSLAMIIFYWNVFNALTDIVLLLGLLPDFLSSFHEGFYSSLCLNAGLYKNLDRARQYSHFTSARSGNCWIRYLWFWMDARQMVFT